LYGYYPCSNIPISIIPYWWLHIPIIYVFPTCRWISHIQPLHITLIVFFGIYMSYYPTTKWSRQNSSKFYPSKQHRPSKWHSEWHNFGHISAQNVLFGGSPKALSHGGTKKKSFIRPFSLRKNQGDDWGSTMPWETRIYY
jgi:hypothetical protein